MTEYHCAFDHPVIQERLNNYAVINMGLTSARRLTGEEVQAASRIAV